MCSVLLRSDSTQVSQERENHHLAVEEDLKRWSGSRPPKTELTGVLVPCLKVVGGYLCLYKLETDSQDFFLKMTGELA